MSARTKVAIELPGGGEIPAGTPARIPTAKEHQEFLDRYGYDENDEDVFVKGTEVVWIDGKVRIVLEDKVEWG